MAGPSNIPPPMPPQYGAPPPFQQFPPQQSNPLKMVLIVGGVIFALMFLGGIAVGIFAVAMLPGRGRMRVDLERKQMRELHAALERAEADPANQKKFAAMKDKAGR
ncbi:hypothetical protein BAC2_00147 [uncultured bacterium]|nr:hypothetical protein BAC2_00147 [uncultured bacterium]